MMERLPENDMGLPFGAPQTGFGLVSTIAGMEAALRDGFVDMVQAVDLRDIAHLEDGRSLPRNMGEYGLTAIVPDLSDFNGPLEEFRSLRIGAQSGIIDPAVETNYRNNEEPPYLDTSFAIGLVFQDALSAVGSAGLTEEGRVLIPQLQAVSGHVRDNRFQSGLFGGFNWRCTLVAAWRDVAEEIGAPALEIQSAKNNMWRRSTVGKRDPAIIEAIHAEQARFELAYDGVARQLGFERDAETGNWVERIA